MDEPCTIHEMRWCAICSGAAKRFEQDEKDDGLPTFDGLRNNNPKKDG